MKNKSLISIIVLLFVISFFAGTVIADNENKTLNDSQGDVIDGEGNIVIGKDEFDIDKIIYTNVNGLVTFEIQLHGIITESPNITIILFMVTSDMTTYYLASEGVDVYGEVLTSNEDYEQINVSFEGFGTSSLTYSFDLIDENEKYFYMMVQIGEVSEIDPNIFNYSDQYPDEDIILDAEIQSPETAKVGDNVQFSSLVIDGTPPFTYKWDFNDDGVIDSELQNPQHIFTETGEYYITLIVQDDTGNIGGNSTYINIISESSNGSQDEKNNQSSGLTLFIILIVIVVLAGIAVVVYLIRR